MIVELMIWGFIIYLHRITLLDKSLTAVGEKAQSNCFSTAVHCQLHTMLICVVLFSTKR